VVIFQPGSAGHKKKVFPFEKFFGKKSGKFYYPRPQTAFLYFFCQVAAFQANEAA
jgi:hypothetical protein